MTLAQIRVPSLTVRLYLSEQGKSGILRLNLHIMSNEIFCANCISMLDCLSNNALLRYTKRLQKDSNKKHNKRKQQLQAAKKRITQATLCKKIKQSEKKQNNAVYKKGARQTESE